MQTIFLGLGRLSHASDILRSPLLQALADRYRVVVLSTHLDNTTAEKERFLAHQHISYVKIKETNERFFGYSNRYFRLSLIHRYDSWLLTRHWYYRKNHPLIIRLTMQFGKILPRQIFDAELFTKLETFFAKKSPALEALIQKEKPVAMVTATPGYTTLEAELIIVARRHRIPSIAIDINYDNAYSQAKFVRRTDYISVWNNRMKKEIGDAHGYAESHIRAVGCLRFDHYANDQKRKLLSREEFLVSKGLNPKKPLVVYVGPSPITYPPRGTFAKGFIELKEQHLLKPDPNILIRLHPHDVWEPYEPFTNIPEVRIERAGKQRVKDQLTKGQKVEMDDEDLVNLTETLRYADVVINYVSTMIIEACIFDKPVISVGYPSELAIANDYEFNKALNSTGAVTIAKSPEDLGNAINAYLANPKKDSKERHTIVNEHALFTDGKSWERTATYIYETIEAYRASNP